MKSLFSLALMLCLFGFAQATPAIATPSASTSADTWRNITAFYPGSSLTTVTMDRNSMQDAAMPTIDCSGVGAVGISDTRAHISLLGFEDCEYGFNNQKNVHIYWGPIGTGFPFNNSFIIAGDYYRINDLTPCTQYEYEVYVKCDGVWEGPCYGTFWTTGC